MHIELDEQSALAPFLDEGWITEVLDTIKSGKEATVYRCKAHPRTGQEFFAAKVYRELKHRSFRKDSIYQEGRVILDGRVKRAVEKNTNMGLKFRLIMWVFNEYETLCMLYNAGAGVPKPVTKSHSAILMEYLGNSEESAGPLNIVKLEPDKARLLFDSIMEEIELWLACNIVHGDLSPYNIVYWQERAMVIDLPQAVDPRFNRNAFDLLLRDITNVCKYFARYGVEADPYRLADGLWTRFQLGEL